MGYMSQEGYDKMVAQLKHMESIERPAASAAIAEARDKGDLSENSEYDAAKEAQAMLEMSLSEDCRYKHTGQECSADFGYCRNGKQAEWSQNEIYYSQ